METDENKLEDSHEEERKGVKTRVITDCTGRKRTVKIPEKRKAFSVYVPEQLYYQFDAITTAYRKSHNSTIVELIRDYVTEKRDILDKI